MTQHKSDALEHHFGCRHRPGIVRLEAHGYRDYLTFLENDVLNPASSSIGRVRTTCEENARLPALVCLVVCLVVVPSQRITAPRLRLSDCLS